MLIKIYRLFYLPWSADTNRGVSNCVKTLAAIGEAIGDIKGCILYLYTRWRQLPKTTLCNKEQENATLYQLHWI